MDDSLPSPAETGGPTPIMYTTTKAQSATKGEATMGVVFMPRTFDDPGVDLFLDSAFGTKVTSTTPGGKLQSLGYKAVIDPNGHDSTAVLIRVSTGALATDPAIGSQRAYLWAKKADLGSAGEVDNAAWHDSLWALAGDPKGRYPAPPVPGDCTDEVKAAIAKRDAEWQEWLLAGNPGT
jgi:hypothetical protein